MNSIYDWPDRPKIREFIYCPLEQDGLQVGELNPEAMLRLVQGLPDQLNEQTFTFDGKEYIANLGASRLHCMKNSLTCACCGITANRCSLDLNKQATKETGRPFYSVNFYAETGDKNTGKRHLVLMTRDHIVPRDKGGSDDLDNSQTLCWNCNSFKAILETATGKPLEVNLIKGAMFPAYRAYKSSVALSMTKELTSPYRYKVEKAKGGIHTMTKALEIVKDERAEGIKKKILRNHDLIDFYTAECDRIELQAQLTGIAPSKVEIAEPF